MRTSRTSPRGTQASRKSSPTGNSRRERCERRERCAMFTGAPLSFAAQALQEIVGVGRGSRALCLPHHFAQAFERIVQRIVAVIVLLRQPFDFGPHAFGTIDPELLGHAQM